MNKIVMENSICESNILVHLKRLLFKPYTVLNDKREVIFFVPSTSFLLDSISPLILKYMEANRKIIILFQSIKSIADEGWQNILQIIHIIEELQTKGESVGGVRCYTLESIILCKSYFDICFICSEYSGRVPPELRKVSHRVVALQTTAIYTHVYFIRGKFEENFSEYVWKEIDYLITSEYIADWICEKNKNWKKKILMFGYPKLDTLFSNNSTDQEIPDEWKERIGNKKVFLFMTRMKQSWLEFFEKAEDKVAIWRPQPAVLAIEERRKEIEDLSIRYNILIDSSVAYYTVFQISDALITSPPTSVLVNYLYTKKPVCLLDSKEARKSVVLDYQDDIWYKAVDYLSL